MKTFTKQDVRCVSTVEEGVMLALWKQSYDTFEIDRHLRLPESKIYNRLFHLRQKDKECQPT